MTSLLICLWVRITMIDSTHFNGGTITWFPVYPQSSSSSVLISITQTYSWSYPLVGCTTNAPSTNGYAPTTLRCAAYCSTDGGYSSSPLSTATDCTYSSSSLSLMTSTRTRNISLNLGAYFYIGYIGNAWRSLSGGSIASASWSVVSLIDLHWRTDGCINTPPVASVISPQYVIVNIRTYINIPVTDANINDNIRCRWSANPNPAGVDECGGVCYPAGLPSGTTLSNCTVGFTGPTAGSYYSLAIQVFLKIWIVDIYIYIYICLYKQNFLIYRLKISSVQQVQHR